MSGFALGQASLESLEQVGIRQTALRWQYNAGITRPTGPYPPHKRLSGAHLNGLPTPDGYFLGDHPGCRCSTVPVLRSGDGRFVSQTVVLENLPADEGRPGALSEEEAKRQAEQIANDFEQAALRCER